MKNTYYLHIDEFGNIYKVLYRQDSTLKDLQATVDGLIDVVVGELHEGTVVDVFVNDEGLFRNDFFANTIASSICRRPIAGPVTLAKTSAEGETLGLTSEEIDKFGFLLSGECVADEIAGLREETLAQIPADLTQALIRPLGL